MANQLFGQTEFFPTGSGVCLPVSFSTTTSREPFACNFSRRRTHYSPSGTGFVSNDEAAIFRGEIPHNRGHGTGGNCQLPTSP